jgi:hypothetical protein
MSDCSFCKYRLSDDDNTKQTCSKWINKDEPTIPCKPSGKQNGDSPNDDSENCININCPSNCQYPYPKGIYNEPASKDEYYGNNSFPDLKKLKNNNELLTSYLTDVTNDVYLKEDVKRYNKDNILSDVNLKCGALVVPEGDDFMNFPILPTEYQLRNTIDKEYESQKIGIDWGAIKETDKLRELYNDLINGSAKTVTINDYIIPLSPDGIELEWWDKTYTESELKLAIPENIRQSQDVKVIHETTGGILEYVFDDHNESKIVIEEIYDWLRKRKIKTDEKIKEKIKEGDSQFTMAQFFGITSDEATNIEFESCLNRTMMTDHDDEEFLKRINTYTHLSEIGNSDNRKDLLYIESKIIKFITVSPDKLSKCFDIVYVTDEICKKGLSSNAVEMLGYFLDLDTDKIETEKYENNIRIVSNRLLKYLPDIIKKIITIAKTHEKKNCNGEISKNTIVLEEIYKNLFLKNNQMSFDYPDLGILEFFQDFQKNIFTKSVLLIFVAFILTQIIGLFSVQYNVNK